MRRRIRAGSPSVRSQSAYAPGVQKRIQPGTKRRHTAAKSATLASAESRPHTLEEVPDHQITYSTASVSSPSAHMMRPGRVYYRVNACR